MKKEKKEYENEMLKLGVYALVVRGIGEDLLMGRNVNDYIKLHGLEDLLQQFIKDLDVWFYDVYENNIQGFLLKMQEKLLLDFTQLEENISQNMKGMQEMGGDEVMIQYMIITKTLESMREQIFNTFISKDLAAKYKELYKKTMTQKMSRKLKDFVQMGAKELSLLYNLVFINHLAKIYDDTSMLKTTENQIITEVENFFKDLK